MQYRDVGIIFKIKSYGEESLIIKLVTKSNGICRGFVKSAKSTKARSIYQIGNNISFEYRARNEDGLGSFYSVDLIEANCSKIIFEKIKIDCVRSLFTLIDIAFLENDYHEDLYEEVNKFLTEINIINETNLILAKYIWLELKILEILGYGIDTAYCAVTNSKENLAFVSPKTGRAVTLEVGKPYQNKLLKLPNFNKQKITNDDIMEGLKLSWYFLDKYLVKNNSSICSSFRKGIIELVEDKNR